MTEWREIVSLVKGRTDDILEAKGDSRRIGV